ncbi:hypothetical protein J1N35_005884 [Gossypium stocksii]|uniref:Uncharacterized protein n=1 Tax=Gossypium stocksii TaxID=47602 RepID=A0A9D3WEP7_9ROSI|nr:hypothetical protein J1N35_005884 [Gossypium stocksii]
MNFGPARDKNCSLRVQHLYQLKSHNWENSSGFYYFSREKISVASLCRESGKKNVNLLIDPTNLETVADVSIHRCSEKNLSEIDRISHEINEAMDIDSLIRKTRKRRMMTIGATNVVCTSEEERNSGCLEQCRKIRMDPASLTTTVIDVLVVGGPFDARRVDFDALCDIDMGELRFDLYFLLGAVWDEFVAK